MQEENRRPAQQKLCELTSLIQEADHLIADGDEDAAIAKQYFTEELNQLSSRGSRE